MCLEYLSRPGHHRRIVRVTFRGSVGTAAQAPAKALPIENLVVGQVTGAKSAGGEKNPDFVRLRVGFLDVFVIHPKPLEQLFVLSGEWSVFHAAILPNDNDPAGRFKNAAKFLAGKLDVKPVEGLARGDKIHGLRRQGCSLGGAVDAREIRAFLKEMLPAGAHFGVRLDAQDLISVV